jgi:putative exosortase-associated protein (TIGR04073 family)
MRSSYIIFAASAAIALLSAGCAGPEQKLGRGIRNSLEFARMGEMRASVEKSAIFEGTGASYTSGVIRGFNRTLGRTISGAFDIATFPIPSASIIKPADPIYPACYKPNRLADTIYATDSNLGFSGGDVAPYVLGSRFRVFDQ